MMDYEQRTIGVSVLMDNKPDDGAPSEGDNVLSDVEFVTGGAGDDIFVGNGRPNVFNTYGGNDTISGRGGPDQLGGFGEGNKTISGGGGADLLLGEAGDDLLRGGSGPDTLYGTGGTNVLWGGPGDDLLNSEQNLAHDSVTCGSGDDTASRDRYDKVAADCETRN